MKDIIFKGSSHTMGLGLDLELSKRYNDENWLKENGVVLPPIRTDEDWDNINQHRWPKIVCETLGVKEYDYEHIPKLKHNSLSQFIVDLAITPPKLLAEHISHIIYEPQTTRLFYDESQWTPQEMLDRINNKSIPESEKQFIYDWIDNYDETTTLGIKLLKRCIEIHNDIQFIFFMFYGRDGEDSRFEKNFDEFEDKIIKFTINNQTSNNLYKLLQTNKLRVCDTAYCYKNRMDEFGNPKWDIGTYEDIHAGVEAQSIIAENVINHIKQTKSDYEQ